MSAATVVIESVYERWNRNDLAVELFDPRIEVRQQPRVFDTAGTFHGHEGLLRAAEELRAGFQSITWRPTRWTEKGDWLVVALEVAGTGIRSGAPTETAVAHLWRVRNGRITDLRVYDTEAEALEAAGLSE